MRIQNQPVPVTDCIPGRRALKDTFNLKNDYFYSAGARQTCISSLKLSGDVELWFYGTVKRGISGFISGGKHLHENGRFMLNIVNRTGLKSIILSGVDF